jgi:hypothetical protein
MGLKRGYILEENTPAAPGAANIRRFKLSNGDQVYLPSDVSAALISRHSPAEEFFFLERGLFGRTAWAGNLHDLRVALADGHLKPKDVGGLRLPVQEEVPGWAPMVEEDDHRMVGEKADPLADMLRKRGMPESAETLTVEAWVNNCAKQGWCIADRADSLHGRVWCGRENAMPNHPGTHIPVCPKCQSVKMAMYAMYKRAGAWG